MSTLLKGVSAFTCIKDNLSKEAINQSDFKLSTSVNLVSYFNFSLSPMIKCPC